jgi:SAM-dependent methyltransferase
MSSYLGKHAEYYDIFYRDKPYASEAAFVHQQLQRYGHGDIRQLLELACGTGRHAFELEKLGYEIVATDYSLDLLKIAQQKADEKKSRVEFIFQDMRDISLPERKFDAAYCLFDSLGYVQTNSAVGQVMEGVHSHLKVNGLFIFEFWHAAAMIKSFESKRERRWKTDAGEILRVSSTRLDIPKQLAEVTYKITETADGKVVQVEETQVNRYFLVQEMASFLENHRFFPIEFVPAYEVEKPIDDSTWHVLAIARRVEQ